MEHYVGLDVSLKLTSICIVDRTGRVEREGVVASDPEAIATFIKLHAPHIVRFGLETGVCNLVGDKVAVPAIEARVCGTYQFVPATFGKRIKK